MRRTVRGAFGLAAVLTAAVAVSGAPAHASFPGRNGVIAYTDAATGQIYTVRPDGTGERQLTTGSVASIRPRWSPDGRFIAFERESPDGQRIFEMDANGAHQHLVVHETPGWRDLRPAFSADGRRIVFSRCQPNDGPCALAIVNVNGTDRRVITGYPAQGPNYEAQFSPNDQWIAYGCFEQQGYLARVCLIRPNGTDRHAVTPGYLDGASPDWSPDGSRLVFMNHEQTVNEAIYSINVNGTGLTKLTGPAYAHNDGTPAFSPDGRFIAFVSDRSYRNSCCLDLYVMRSDGRDLRRIVSTNGGVALWPSWQPLTG